MKKLFLTLGLLSALCSIATAGFKIPRYAHEDLEEAQKEAKEERKPLAFVYTNPAST